MNNVMQLEGYTELNREELEKEMHDIVVRFLYERHNEFELNSNKCKVFLMQREGYETYLFWNPLYNYTMPDHIQETEFPLAIVDERHHYVIAQDMNTKEYYRMYAVELEEDNEK